MFCAPPHGIRATGKQSSDVEAGLEQTRQVTGKGLRPLLGSRRFHSPLKPSHRAGRTLAGKSRPVPSPGRGQCLCPLVVARDFNPATTDHGHPSCVLQNTEFPTPRLRATKNNHLLGF